MVDESLLAHPDTSWGLIPAASVIFIVAVTLALWTTV